jgi:hypothetical protein
LRNPDGGCSDLYRRKHAPDALINFIHSIVHTWLITLVDGEETLVTGQGRSASANAVEKEKQIVLVGFNVHHRKLGLKKVLEAGVEFRDFVLIRVRGCFT